MAENLILTSQKNQVLSAIEYRDLDPSEFQWTTWPSNQTALLTVSKVIHRPTGYYFMFDFKEGEHFAEFSPGGESQVEYDHSGSWEYQADTARKWLICLEREIEAPDLWGAVAQEKKLAEAASSSETPNSPFTPEEQQSLSDGIREIERYVIETHGLTGEHAEFVKRRLEYLADSVKRLGRLDWANVAYSALISIVLQIAIPPDATRELLRLAWTLFGPFFGGTPPLPLGA